MSPPSARPSPPRPRRTHLPLQWAQSSHATATASLYAAIGCQRVPALRANMDLVSEHARKNRTRFDIRSDRRAQVEC